MKLSPQQTAELLSILKSRFDHNSNLHAGIQWKEVQSRLENNESKLWSINEMERTGGEPDVIGRDESSGAFIFVDCAPESPKGRRSICYDHQALESRKENKPVNSAVNMALDMGIALLDESEYRALQQLGKFDVKTSSWVATPAEIRKLGGAIFCDRRYNTIFVYHNGAESYYAARGFRGKLML